MTTDAQNSAHNEISLLLPWYVNGTLGDGEKSLVEIHVRSCIACRRALESEYRTLDVFRNENPLDQSVQAGFEHLHRRIATRPPSRLRDQFARSANLAWSRLVSRVSLFTGGRLRPALVALPLALVAVGVGLNYLVREQPGGDAGNSGAATAGDDYHTLSSAGAGIANPDDVHVIFARGTNRETIDTLLQPLPARIVAGPDNVGVYTVRLVNVSGESERQAAIVGLRGKSQVIFAEAAQPLSVSNQRRVQAQ